ncbi:thioredoxin-like protein [Phellopilus nigrolimitatus]|nr:thioredoxin-like protein [Phellopilus nigrolimitatus]
MPSDSETIPAQVPIANLPPSEDTLAHEEAKEEQETETAAPRRSSRITGGSKSAVEEKGAAKKGAKKTAVTRKRSADDSGANEKAKGPINGIKKAKTTKSKNTEDDGLALGDPLPVLTVKNEKDEDIDVQDIAGDSAGVVLFLVPKADTPGCTTQACGFRDSYPDFEALNFKVFCLSADTPKAQSKWQTKKSLPYPLLSDPKRALIGALTAGTSKTARSHFIFAQGKLVDKKIPVKPADSPRLALAFIKSLKTASVTSSGLTEEDSAAPAVAESSADAMDTDVTEAKLEAKAEAEVKAQGTDYPAIETQTLASATEGEAQPEETGASIV